VKLRIALVPVVLALSACTAFGPDRRPPQMPQPAHYSIEAQPAQTAQADGVAQQVAIGARPVPKWWTAYGSDDLNALVEEGLKKQGAAYLQAGGPDPFKDFDSQAKDLKLTGSIDRLQLQRAIDRLPPGYRTVFVLHDVEGFEHNEIAQIVGCSIGNSKSQLHKARLKLRDYLKFMRAEKAKTG